MNKALNAWKEPIANAVLERIEHHQSMTAAEIIDEVQPPPELRKELRRFVFCLFEVLQERGELARTNECRFTQ